MTMVGVKQGQSVGTAALWRRAAFSPGPWSGIADSLFGRGGLRFGRVIAEVGAVMMVGAISGTYQVMTTAMFWKQGREV